MRSHGFARTATAAAATFGGRSSDEGSLVGPPAGIGGGEEGWPGSVGSGMYYIHRIKGTFVNSECVLASFDFPFVALSHLERFGCITQTFACHRAANLLQRAMRTLDLALVRFEFQLYASLNSLSGIYLFLGNIPVGNR